MLSLFPGELVSVCSLVLHVQVDTASAVAGNHHIAGVEAAALEAAHTVVVEPAHTVVVGSVHTVVVGLVHIVVVGPVHIAVVEVAHIVAVDVVHIAEEGAGHILAVDRVVVDHGLAVGSIKYKKSHITVYMKYISSFYERIQHGFATM